MIGPKAYIAKDKLERNIKNIRTYIGPKKLMIVVKANGYGHGLLNVASIISIQEDIIFCVFNIQEAIFLRENGIRNNIFIFSRIQQDWVIRAFELDLWVNICHWDDLLLVDKIISETGLCPKIHLKFDTGMTRLGFDITDSEKVFNFLKVINNESNTTIDENRLKETIGQIKYENERVDRIQYVKVFRMYTDSRGKKQKILLGEGSAALKPDAQQRAATRALEYLNREGKFIKEVPEIYKKLC